MLVLEGLEILDEETCIGLLSKSRYGRVGVSVRTLPGIYPVVFRLLDRALYFRVERHSRLSLATNGTVVAFECEELDARHRQGWSVLVIGMARHVIPSHPVFGELADVPLWPDEDGDGAPLVRMPLEFVSGRRIIHH